MIRKTCTELTLCIQRWLFIIEGVLTVGMAIIFAVLCPNLPSNSWQFSKIQRDLAVYRLEREAGSVEEPVSMKQGFILAVTDIKTYFFSGRIIAFLRLLRC
jgi:hypothetical protein